MSKSAAKIHFFLHISKIFGNFCRIIWIFRKFSLILQAELIIWTRTRLYFGVLRAVVAATVTTLESARQIQKCLREMDLDFPNIMGVLVTHDHADHIRAVGTLGERVHLPIYTTAEIHEGIDRNYGVREKLRTSRRYFEKGKEWELFGMRINTFGIEHDSTDCLGYCIDYLGQRFVLMTDCGSVNDEMEAYIRTANHLVIEANHDEHMLLNGPYPTYLKERILSPRGHQSNDVCGELLERNWHPELRNVWLCHLSLENNSPEVAYDTVASYLEEIEIMPGQDIFLKPLDRTSPSPVYELNEKIISQ